MAYPKLKKTPIKEIIFSISYEEIIDENGFDNGYRQNINLSDQKELIYYNTDGSIWKKIN